MTGMDGTAGAATIMLPERLDSESSKTIEKTILDALHPGARVIVDGSAVGYMSAAGVRTLATVLHRAEEQQAHIVFCQFNGAAADCLVVSGFTQLFNVANSAEEARAKLAAGASTGPAERLHARRAAR